MKKYYSHTVLLVLTLLVLLFPKFSAGQNGTLFGYVRDSATNAPIPFTVVVIKSGETVINGAQADEKGTYKISGIAPGIYTAEATYSNYPANSVKGVIISAENTTRLDFALSASTLGPAVITIWKRPLINPQDVSTTYTIDEEDFEHSALNHQIKDLPALAPGVYQRDVGQPINIRGSRDDATIYIVDGMKMVGNFNVPSCAVEQMSVLTGGIPAEYGDATGGFVIITTKSYFSQRDR